MPTYLHTVTLSFPSQPPILPWWTGITACGSGSVHGRGLSGVLGEVAYLGLLARQLDAFRVNDVLTDPLVQTFVNWEGQGSCPFNSFNGIGLTVEIMDIEFPLVI